MGLEQDHEHPSAYQQDLRMHEERRRQYERDQEFLRQLNDNQEPFRDLMKKAGRVR